METIKIVLNVPESFTKDCERYKISEEEMLQYFVCHLHAVCTITTGNNHLLITKTARVFKDYLETTITVPVGKDKGEILTKMTQEILAMTYTKTIPWSEQRYTALVKTAYRELHTINVNNG